MSVIRVVLGLVATLGMFTLYGIVLPVAAMAIALYLVRAWPLTRRRP
jgi:hypothetical protein